jgi:hypothetical protein
MDRPVYRRIHLNRLSQEVGPPHIETAVEAMDQQPPSLELLRDAVELISSGTKTILTVKLDPPYLRVRRKSESFNAKVEEGGYRLFYMCQGDSWDAHERATSALAWKMVGKPRPKALAKAAR